MKILALVLLFGFIACSKGTTNASSPGAPANNSNNNTPPPSGTPPAGPTPPTTQSQGISKIILVILENTSYADAKSAPYLSKLAAKGALLTNSFGVDHPSQPNYIAIVAGDELGVSGDGTVNVNGSHIGDLIESKGKTWKAYAEKYPGNCYKGSSSGSYVRKHLPFISFSGVQSDSTKCGKIVEASQFFTDAQNKTLPNFSFYVPDLNNDGHDTGVTYADNWLSQTFDALLSDSQFMQNTLFIVTFDEDDFVGANQVFTAFYGPNVIPGSVSNTRYDHYSILRTIEDSLGLGTLGKNDATAQPVTGIWK